MKARNEQEPKEPPEVAQEGQDAQDANSEVPDRLPPELGGPVGPEPTRYGDWERAGRCIDF